MQPVVDLNEEEIVALDLVKPIVGWLEAWEPRYLEELVARRLMVLTIGPLPVARRPVQFVASTLRSQARAPRDLEPVARFRIALAPGRGLLLAGPGHCSDSDRYLRALVHLRGL
ncbi:MAG: hypothetical protein H7Z16_05110 [Pyrinomonadaceae bacterium]|nr:hypothetical protein [Pyrinomonadaceae bacterium]